ncbi:MAG TPA: hypothetical protein VHM26_10580 [Chitinophagaceae bacterium]|nr:hypothetical protein [Chitinophagaceae bacterium]
MQILKIIGIAFTTLALVPELAHVFEMKTKMKLSKNHYRLVQRLYKGWAFFGIAIVIGLIASVAIAIGSRDSQSIAAASWMSVLCISFALIFFFIVIFPINRQTKNWTIMPDNWVSLRSQWENAHAISAVLYSCALIMLVLSSVEF